MPLIAAVNGPAVGLGCDLACLADIRIAAATARFGVTFLKLGLIPGDGGAWILPRIVGASRAAELLYTGKVIDAETALAWGMLSRVVAPEELMPAAQALAEEIAAQPGQALRATKMLLRQAQTASYDATLEIAASTQALMHQTPEHIEAATKLLDKSGATDRKPG